MERATKVAASCSSDECTLKAGVKSVSARTAAPVLNTGSEKVVAGIIVVRGVKFISIQYQVLLRDQQPETVAQSSIIVVCVIGQQRDHNENVSLQFGNSILRRHLQTRLFAEAVVNRRQRFDKLWRCFDQQSRAACADAIYSTWQALRWYCSSPLLASPALKQTVLQWPPQLPEK